MKILTILALLAISVQTFATKPEYIPSKITELRSKSWYKEASTSWKVYLEENPNDEIGWIQYYRAVDFAGGSSEDLQQIVSKLSIDQPESFGVNYLNFKQLGWNQEGVKELTKALGKNSKHAFTYEDQLVLTELTDRDSRKEMSNTVYESGLLHSSTLNYTYNLLMSVSENGLLITDGVHMTVPIWILQDVMEVRTDVKVLNLELARSQPNYLNRVLSESNMPGNLEMLLSDESASNVYYALTLPRERLAELESRLYVVGLASTIGGDDFNHFQTLKENIEDRFLMDYLTIDFNGDPKTATGNVLSSNYIVPLLLLKEFYDKTDNKERSQTLREQILRLAEDSQIKARVDLLLSASESPRSFKIVEMDVKKLDKSMKLVKNQIYASAAEVQNRQYYDFMEYLRTNGYGELYEKGQVDFSKYDDLTKAMLSNYHYSPQNMMAMKVQKRMEEFLSYPVLSLTHEMAKVYCEWLTVQYNAQDKRKFKKVIFRLPSKKEWTMAALGFKDFQSWELNENVVKAKPKEGKGDYFDHDLARSTISYPWGLHSWELRNSIRNRFNCYLANIDAGDEITCKAGIKGDGWTLTSPVETYFPNQMGLFDMIGNVAEMIDEEGIAMGGSWNHKAEESTIVSENTYEGSDISVGFRLFMEVIEE